jgi:chromosome segregation ATPase
MAEHTRRDAGKNKANDTFIECASLERASDAPELCTPDESRPIVTVGADAGEQCSDDLDSTAEFPVLVLDDALCDGDESVRALEESTEPAEAKDTLLTDLCRQIEERANAQRVLENDLEQATARIAELGAAQAAREIDVALVESNLQDARDALAAAEARCAALAEEKAKLSDAVDRHAEAAVGAHQRYEDQVRRASRLSDRLQELESYIDGSKQRWSALNEELAEHRDWLGVSERREAWALAQLTAETNARKRLASEAAELQRRLVKLVAQVAERDTAHRDVERRLEEERAAATQLRADIASATARADRALGESNALAERVAALERALSARQEELRVAVEGGAQKERDLHAAEEKIARLEGLLREAGHEVDELVTAIEQHESKIDRLEADLREKQDAIALLDGSIRRLDPIGVDTGSEGLDRPRTRARIRDAQGRAS